MPSQPNNAQRDALIRIVLSAYRRGLAIMRQREQIAGTTALKHNLPTAGEIGEDGENCNSRNVPAKDGRNADTPI